MDFQLHDCPFIAKAQVFTYYLIPNFNRTVFQALAFRADRWSEFDMTRSLRRVRSLACSSPIPLGTKPTARIEKAIPTASESDSSQVVLLKGKSSCKGPDQIHDLPVLSI